jgi:hypothetical protein
MQKEHLIFISLLGLTIIFGSCTKRNRFEIDTTKNRIDVKIHRFDKDLLSLDTINMKAGVNSLYAHYPEFLPVFTSEIMNTASTDTVAVRNLFYKYLTDTAFTLTNKKTIQTFSDISGIEKQLSTAFTYIHHYFPEVRLPEIYFFVSGFNQSLLMNDKFIGIGTDFYLGSDFPPYKSMSYDYLIKNMRKECLTADLVSALLLRIFNRNSTENRLLDNILFRGKVLYLMAVILPDEKPESIIGYSADQWKWCKTYEKQIWAAIIDQKHLFSSDILLINKYVNEAPFTSPISQESPGKLGAWIGWQIVKSYMDKNTTVSLSDLMKENNYQKMLEESGYRP